MYSSQLNAPIYWADQRPLPIDPLGYPLRFMHIDPSPPPITRQKNRICNLSSVLFSLAFYCIYCKNNFTLRCEDMTIKSIYTQELYQSVVRLPLQSLVTASTVTPGRMPGRCSVRSYNSRLIFCQGFDASKGFSSPYSNCLFGSVSRYIQYGLYAVHRGGLASHSIPR